MSSETTQPLDDDRVPKSINALEEELPVSLKSTRSRVGSASSQNSVMWRTHTTSDIGSELGFIERQDKKNQEEKKNRCLQIISGKNFQSFFRNMITFSV